MCLLQLSEAYDHGETQHNRAFCCLVEVIEPDICLTD